MVLWVAWLGCEGDGPAAARERPLAEAEAIWVGAGAGDWTGRVATGVGDLDGDGSEDIAFGSLWNDAAGEDAGAVQVWYGAASGVRALADAPAVITGEEAHDAAGVALAGTGDLDGDGFGELLIGADGHDAPQPNAGAVYLLRGPIAGSVSLGDADAKWVGEGNGDLAGVSVASAGDADGDGTPDLLVGARFADLGASNAGLVYFVSGARASTGGSLGTADAALAGEAEGDWAGLYTDGIGDVDGDGIDDVGVGARYSDRGAADGGSVYVVLGPLDGLVPLGDARAIWSAIGAGDEALRLVGRADLDGDGRPDLAIGAKNNDEAGAEAGAVYVVLDVAAPGARSLAEAPVRYLGGAAGDEAGWRVGAVGDALAVGAWLADGPGGADAGAAYLVEEVGPGTSPLPEAAALIALGEAPGDQAGTAIGGAGDVDGNGVEDWVVSAALSDRGGEDAGAAYLLLR